ncbi:hypothetical protein [Adlercreutzia faecimuris]|uniref:Uncharacterized protein n=1 Tax=Adlercreutzia faecimuris TaxID=2897341 RepID=A0ABS9WJC4_9ACTN|nr:hypothetical protein [Adlercreutzia sp. JBNU-10]MCI2242974.1 hypothetical protein [Adlercreutzia sp. JBNU-10]
MLNEKALKVLSTLSEPDAAYCHKLARRFANLGIAPDNASSAVCALVEADAIPEAGVVKVASLAKPAAPAAERPVTDQAVYA